MLSNLYGNLELDLGLLICDVKKKICQDCELVALLKDDNGMLQRDVGEQQEQKPAFIGERGV